MIDFHTHILPRIDDGAGSEEISLEMLKSAYALGTDVVVLTSHFYPREAESIKSFLDRRGRRYKGLVEFCAGHEIPEMRLAAEVNLHTNISKFPDLHDLCIEGTDYMLVEMPMSKWEDWMYECIYNLTVKGIKPIIAHIDRYLHYPKSALTSLDEVHPIYQVNADAFLTFKGRCAMLRLFNEGKLHIIGSDMHGLEKRKNNLPQAYIELESRFGEEFIAYVEQNGEKILDNDKVSRRKKHFPKVKKTKLLF